MADIRKILGQAAPAAATEGTLYTVPAASNAVTSTLVVANRGTTEATFRVWVRQNGATTADKQYLLYDAPLQGNASAFFTLGLTLNTGDVVSVRASTGNLSFNLFGGEGSTA